MENNEKQLNLEIRPDIAGGQYSNLALITHSHSEFILDFAQMLPAMPKPQVCSRIIMTPEHAKRLMNALVDNINKYEAHFGPIQLDNQAPKGTFNIPMMGGNNGSNSYAAHPCQRLSTPPRASERTGAGVRGRY